MRSTITLLLLLMAFSSGSFAQEILGVVTDSKKEPLVNATVQVKQKGILKGSTVTDFDGKYSIKPLDSGVYDVSAMYLGYTTRTVSMVIVKPNEKTGLNFALTASGGKALKEVNVVYERPLVDQYKHSTVIEAKCIKNKPTTQTFDIVSQSPGMYHQKRGGALNSTGSRNGGNLYVIDGVQVQGAHNELSAPPPPPPTYFNPSEESYKKMPVNDFMTVKSTPVSTMSVDVDKASYTNIRRFIDARQKPPVDAVRIEEMINYFDYNYPQPTGNDPVAMETQLTVCPWQKDHLLLHIGLQAKTINIDDLPASNLVFLIDVSGSMMEANKLPLLQESLKLLVDKLREKDKVSIVVYAGNAGLVLPPTAGSNKEIIKQAIDGLRGGGSTAGGAGIKLAYKVAVDNFIKGGNNRVLLCTDGDFNVGVSSDNELETLIVKERESGVFLTCLGFGMGNYKDSKMEMLADKGNGNYNYIDNLNEGKKTLVSEFGGTIFTLAKDVKCQIEFNPTLVAGYRLIGYENRLLNTEDFKDDKKDAGDMGSGHTVTVLYEIIPANKKGEDVRPTDNLKYQNAQFTASSYNNELGTLKLRYKQPADSVSREMSHIVRGNVLSFEQASENMGFSAAVAMFGMMLKNDQYKGNTGYEAILNIARANKGKDANKYRAEFIGLVKAQAEYDSKTTAK